MDDLFEALCVVLEEEAERQETVAAVCEAQQRALAVRDVEQIEAKTAALEILIEEAADAQEDRVSVLRALVDRLELPVERQTLSELIRVAPPPWSRRLAEAQAALRAAISLSEALVRENHGVLHASIKSVERCLNALSPAPASGGRGYTPRGSDAAALRPRPALMDQRG